LSSNGALPLTTSNGDVLPAGSIIEWDSITNGTLTAEAVWLDEIETYFTDVDANGVMTARSSSVYNHALGTWAMYLSCAAYTPPAGEDPAPEEDPDPESDEDATIYTVLMKNGFDRANIKRYNTGLNDPTQHTIAHRYIAAPSSTQSANNSTAAPSNAQNLNNMEGGLQYANLASGSIDTVGAGDGISNIVGLNNEILLVDSRPLVVVAVRGTLTSMDYVVDIAMQLGLTPNFSTQKDEVLSHLQTYISEHDLVDPIILITGHSLGAAVANLLAAHLNAHAINCKDKKCKGCKNNEPDVFAYTFATPRSVKGSKNSYTNIFNILNRNDAVPYLPVNFIPFLSTWHRHGIDYFMNMDPGGYEENGYGHHPYIYLNWMKKGVLSQN